MGKFDGKRITGMVGNLVFREGKNGGIVQTAPDKVRQTKDTKLMSGIFGQRSILAAAMRYNLVSLYRENNDGQMVNRLNKPVGEVLRQCYDKSTGTYTFEKDSFSRLAGLEFNIKSPLNNSMWVQPEMMLDGAILRIKIPQMEIPADFKFYSTSNCCELTAAVYVISLENALEGVPMVQTITIDQNQDTVPAQVFEFEVPEGGLCVAGIGLDYFFLQNGIKRLMNSKEFSPAALCGAVITPGTFVLRDENGNPAELWETTWSNVFKLNL
ncbi:MAG TPA: hypothetical protein VKB19_15535 [Pedobacter sp.]|nr:hypothetical protein [Pedobacter sp.]